MNWTRAFGIFLIVLSVSSSVVAGIALERQGDITDCQADYNAAFTDAIAQNRTVILETRAAFRDMQHAAQVVVATAASLTQNPPGNQEGATDELIGAMDHYLAAAAELDDRMAKADRIRAESPLPDAPTC